MRTVVLLLAAGAGMAVAGHALAQQPAATNNAASATAAKPWVAPGTPGSPIDGTVFHAQVLLDAAGFPSGVIDGKKGMVFEQAVRGFQQSRNLPVTGELDGATRQALLQLKRPSTRMLQLGENDVRGPFVFPFPKDAADQAKLDGLHYRNSLEQLAERFHTTPQTIVALNGPDKPIGLGAVLRLPNVLPGSRDYAGAIDDKQGRLLNFFNVDANQPKGDFIVVDKSEGVMRVYEGEVPKGSSAPIQSGAGAQARRQSGQAGRAIPGDDGLVAISASDRALEGRRPMPSSRRSNISRGCSRGRTRTSPSRCFRRDPTGRSGSPGSTSPRSITASTAPIRPKRSAGPKARAASGLPTGT